MCPSLPMLQAVSIKVCTQQSALEYPAIETGAIQIRMEDFSLRNITFAVGETVSCRKAPVALLPRDARLTLALPRRGITRAVLGTVGRAAASYVTTNIDSGGRVHPVGTKQQPSKTLVL